MRYLLSAMLATASLTFGGVGISIVLDVINGDIIDGLFAFCVSLGIGTACIIGSVAGMVAAYHLARGDWS